MSIFPLLIFHSSICSVVPTLLSIRSAVDEDTDQIVHISRAGVDGGELGRGRVLGVEGEEERVDATKRSLVLLAG